MSRKQLFLLFSIISMSPNLLAVTANLTFAPQRSSSENQVNMVKKVDSQYGLSGIITRYQKEESLIFIDEVSYTFEHINRLAGAAFSIGQKIHYNVEYRPSEKIGRITRIW